MFVTSCSPGPNNIVASHSGFNHGFKKTIPLMLGVIFGFTFMLGVINFGLINIFKIYPIIQKGLIFTGTVFLIYLSYKISFSKSSDENEKLCKAFDVLKNKNMYGKIVKGIERSTFLFNRNGQLIKEWRKVSAEENPSEVLDFVKNNSRLLA